jgi:hypothetical protein
MAEDPRLMFPPALLQLPDQAGHVSLVPVTLAFNVLMGQRAEINGVQPSVVDPGFPFILDLNFFHPGSGSTSASKNLSILFNPCF